MFYIFVDLRQRRKFFDGELFPNYGIGFFENMVTTEKESFKGLKRSKINVLNHLETNACIA